VHQQLVIAITRLRLDLAARVDDVAGAVELAHLICPRFFLADAVDGTDEDAIGGSGCRLFEFPQVLAQAGNGGGWVDDVLCAIQCQRAPAFREMPVVANVDAQFDVSRVEDGITQVARLEEELLVKTGIDLRDMRLAILAEIAAVCIDNRGGVVVDARHLFLVDGHHDNHLVLLRVFLHELRRMALRDALRGGVPLPVLARTEIGLGKHFLETKHLHALLARVFDHGNMSIDHDIPDLVGLHGHVALEGHLDQAAFEFCHYEPRELNRILINQVRDILAVSWRFFDKHSPS